MSVWKSPVLYFGLLLLLLVASALAAPFVVPWNKYRADLENFGQRLTGRSVAIGGDIAVRLFPWPQLQAAEVVIGDPRGFSEGSFVTAQTVRVRLALAGLFSGRLDVESVEVVSPQVNLLRNAAGDVNWIFAPQERVAGRGLLARVKLDRITLRNGIVSYDDLKTGHSAVFAGLNATLSAQSIRGPWRMRGEVKWRDMPLIVNVVTNAKEEGAPLSISTKFTPVDASFPILAIEGSWDSTQFKGVVRMDPQQPTEAKASAEGAFKPLAVQAKVEASADRVSFLRMRIAPADRRDGGTLIEGDAVVEFGVETRARLELKSPRINLDTLIGSSVLAQWRDGGLLAIANRVLKGMPQNFVADYKLNVHTLTSGGQALNAVRLNGYVQEQAIRVREFAAEFPGRSSAVFQGVLFPKDGGAHLGGKFTFDSVDTRAFLLWLIPSWREAVAQHWSGSRGRLQVESGLVEWTTSSFSVRDVKYRFEGRPGEARVVAAGRALASIDVEIKTAGLDVDALMPNGWSVFKDAGLPALMASLVQNSQQLAPRRRFKLQAQSMVLNGVTANDLSVDLETAAEGLAIRHFDIGNVGGARLGGAGSFIDKGEGLDGALSFKLDAEEPLAFLRLIGLDAQGVAWAQALGQTSIKADLQAMPQKSGPELVLDAKGSSGAFEIELSGRGLELEKGRNAILSARATVKAGSSAAFARLLDVDLQPTDDPAVVSFDFKGTISEGFAFATDIKALDAVVKLEGTAKPDQAFWGLTGKLDAKANDGARFLAATGVPLDFAAGQPLLFSSLLAVKEGNLHFLDAVGHVAGHRFSGMASLSAALEWQADFETDLLSVKDAALLAFMPWRGSRQRLDESFAEIDGAPFSGAVFLRPIQFDPLTAGMQKEVVVGLGFSAEGRQLTINAPGEQGIRADVSLKPKSASFSATGGLRWPIDVAKVVTTREGRPLAEGDMILQGEFTASGRSPAAALASTEGKGHFWLSAATFPRMTLNGLAKQSVAALTPEDLAKALSRLDAPPGTTLGQSIGNVSVTAGNLVLSELSPLVEDMDVKVAPQMDLTSGQIKIVTTLKFKGRPDLPPVTVSYVGEPSALDVRKGTSALAAKLGYELLSKDMAALEKLQQEQQALLVKEEAQRAEDERRFAIYQKTRNELREHARIRRFHDAQRAKAEADLKAITDSAVKSGGASGRIELLRHARRLAIHKF